VSIVITVNFISEKEKLRNKSDRGEMECINNTEDIGCWMKVFTNISDCGVSDQTVNIVGNISSKCIQNAVTSLSRDTESTRLVLMNLTTCCGRRRSYARVVGCERWSIKRMVVGWNIRIVDFGSCCLRENDGEELDIRGIAINCASEL